ncbi:MAG TPA: sugar phosphate isomerase/epimerase [Clostridiaceae bacterium]|nr:sugar phosphate isomerase/epimerase [Clostridiaceae bacterium]
MKKSISYWSFVNKSPLEAMKLSKAAGFDGIELTLDESGISPETDPDDLKRIREEAEKLELSLPSFASSLYWKYSFTSDDAEERKNACDTAVTQIKMAKILGADTILLVPGSVSVEFVPERPVVAYDVCWERALESLKELKNVAEEYEINIGIENVWNKFLLSPLEMKQFIDEINSPYVGVYFDVGNVVYSGYPEHWIRILGERIKKVHFKDFRRDPGGLNSFVDLLSGDVNWPEVMNALKDINYDGWVTGEMIPPYNHAPDQIIYNTAASMDAIINGDF